MLHQLENDIEKLYINLPSFYVCSVHNVATSTLPKLKDKHIKKHGLFSDTPSETHITFMLDPTQSKGFRCGCTGEIPFY